MAKAKSQQSFLQRWDVFPAGLVIVLSGLIAWLWRTYSANIEAVLPQFTTILAAVIVLDVVFLLQTNMLDKKLKLRLLQLLAHVTAATLAWLVLWDWWYWEHLNSEWVREVTFFTGKSAITLLFLSLACTPFITLFGWNQLTALKKPLGNYGFLMVCIHLGLFIFDYGIVQDNFSMEMVVREAILKQYAVVGFIAFLLLVPLAITSNKFSQKKLGKKWKSLHKLVYPISVLASVHYIWVWSSKRAFTEPVTYALILAFLLLIRIKPIKDRIRAFKQARRKARRVAA